MKEFLQNNTVTHNLFSFTAFKSLLLFSLLNSAPMSYSEIQEEFRNHPYLKEDVSIDTLRIYMNSLNSIGCVIDKIRVGRINKYSISSHPFTLKLTKEQVNAILKVYRSISKTIELEDWLILQKFLKRISDFIDDEKLKEKFELNSPLRYISNEMLNTLVDCVDAKKEITVYYNSLNSGKKNITILTDKLTINNGRLYLCGLNSEYQNYSRFLCSRILDIVDINNTDNKKIKSPDIIVTYEFYRKSNDMFFELKSNERIISEDKDKYIVELVSKSKFDIMQRIMSHTNRCKVLSPAFIKDEVRETLLQMKEGYCGR